MCVWTRQARSSSARAPRIGRPDPVPALGKGGVMARRWGTLVLILVSAGTQAPLGAQSDGRTDVRPIVAHRARTLVYHPRDLIALRAKLHYTTLIVLPDGDDVVEATCGDKEFWIVNAHGSLVSVKPAKAGSETNLNVLTTSGQVYAFVLTEISGRKGEDPDLTVYLDADEPGTPGTVAARHARPAYVPAEQLDDFRVQAEI